MIAQVSLCREIPLKLPPVWMCVCLVVYQAGLEPSFFTRVIISGAGNPGLRDFRHCSSPWRGWGTWHSNCSWVLTSCHSVSLRTSFIGGFTVIKVDLVKVMVIWLCLVTYSSFKAWHLCFLNYADMDGRIFCKIYSMTYMIHVCA